MHRCFNIYPAFFTAIIFILFTGQYAAAQCQVNKKYLTGRINYRGDTAFVKVSHRYTNRAVYLRKETYAAYQRMYTAALKDGVRLNIISGTRSFHDQVYKWECKWSANRRLDQQRRVLEVLKWSSMPGTSRHHWGTDIDLTNVEPEYYQTRRGKKIYNWLALNAAKFGFYQPFTANRNGGYQEEKWHWSYAPLAKVYIAQYTRYITPEDIKGFPGSQYAGNINIIKNWVLQVNPQCL